jgi:hypothetical protein
MNEDKENKRALSGKDKVLRAHVGIRRSVEALSVAASVLTEIKNDFGVSKPPTQREWSKLQPIIRTLQRVTSYEQKAITEHDATLARVGTGIPAVSYVAQRTSGKWQSFPFVRGIYGF